MMTQTDALKTLRAVVARLANVLREMVRRLRLLARQIVVGLSAAVACEGHPELVPVVARHLQTCSDPLGRALYIASESRMGRWPPPRFINVNQKRE